MPHTSRRKPKGSYIHTRKEETSLDDGWTRISYTQQDRRHGVAPNAQVAKLPPVQPGLSVEKLRSEFDRFGEKWRASECRKRVIGRIGRGLNGSEKKRTEIRKGVAVALGSLSLDWQNRFNSLWQLVVFKDITDQSESPYFIGTAPFVAELCR